MNAMKTRYIITFIGMVVFYLLTVAIGLDQIHRKDAESAEWKRKFESLNATVKKSARTLEKRANALADASKESTEKIIKLESDLPKMLADAKLQGRLEVLNEHLAELAKESKQQASITANRPATQLSYQGAVPAPHPVQSLQTTQENPFWKTYQSVAILRQIRADADKRWGTNYEMVEYQMKGQKEAYEKLMEYRKNYDRVTKGVVAEAEQRWGTNYEMVVYQIKEQLEAKSRIDKR